MVLYHNTLKQLFSITVQKILFLLICLKMSIDTRLVGKNLLCLSV